MREWDDIPTFTDHLRHALYESGWYKGKPLKFYYRESTGKRKKVRGHLENINHVPDKGFFITLDCVHWHGHYFGPVALRFNTKCIEWDKYAAQAFAGAWEVACQKVPKLNPPNSNYFLGIS